MITNYGGTSAILLYNEAQRKKAEAVVSRMVKRAIALEGTVSVSQKAIPPNLTWLAILIDLFVNRENMALV